MQHLCCEAARYLRLCLGRARAQSPDGWMSDLTVNHQGLGLGWQRRRNYPVLETVSPRLAWFFLCGNGIVRGVVDINTSLAEVMEGGCLRGRVWRRLGGRLFCGEWKRGNGWKEEVHVFMSSHMLPSSGIQMMYCSTYVHPQRWSILDQRLQHGRQSRFGKRYAVACYIFLKGCEVELG